MKTIANDVGDGKDNWKVMVGRTSNDIEDDDNDDGATDDSTRWKQTIILAKELTSK